MNPEVNVLGQMTCDLGCCLPNMADVENNKRQWLVMKYRRKHQQQHARSCRKLAGIRLAMINMLFSRYQELMLSLTLSAAMLFSLYSVAKDRKQWARLRPGQWWEVVWQTFVRSAVGLYTSGNPGRNRVLCSHYARPGSNAGRTGVKPCTLPGLKFLTRVGFLILFFCSHYTFDPGQPRFNPGRVLN